MPNIKIPPSPRTEDVSRTPAERQARVAALKQAVSQGTYRPDLHLLAHGLLVDLCWEQLLLNRRPPTPQH